MWKKKLAFVFNQSGFIAINHTKNLTNELLIELIVLIQN